jgi:hypothetical protein
MKKPIGLLLCALSLFLVAPGCGGSGEPDVIEASTDELAELEAQMAADEAEMQAGMEATMNAE